MADTAISAGWQEVVFFDDAWPRLKRNGRQQIEGDSNRLMEMRETFSGIALGIGDNKIRLSITEKFLDIGLMLPILVHPRACIASDVIIEEGTVVFAGSIIQPGTKICKAVIVNTGVTIDHDCVVEEGAHISPGVNIAGHVSIGKRSWIGIGSSIKQGLAVGSDSIVGAGAVVINDIDDYITAVGVPANCIKYNKL